MFNNSDHRIVIIGYGGITPKLRELMLMVAWIKKDVFILPEGDITQGILDELNSEYEVNVNILSDENLCDDIENCVLSLDFMSDLLLSDRKKSKCFESAIFSLAIDAELTSKSSMYKRIKPERCYPKVPPRKLKK